MRYFVFAAVIFAVGLTGCDLYSENDSDSEYVVEAYLIAGSALPDIRLSTTAPFASRYTFEDQGVSDADVAVHLLDRQGGISESYRFVPDTPGVYTPLDSAVVVPERRYALEVRLPSDGAVLRATTHVPGSSEIRSINADTIQYQDAEQLEVRVTNNYSQERQGIYAVTTTALDTVNYDLTPMYAGFVETMEDITKPDLVQNYSGLTNEASLRYDTDAGGSLLLPIPWSSIAFFGPTEVTVAAVDDNLYDFLRSLDSFAMVPGQLENLIDHVEGGRGIFGSMAEARATVFVQPPVDT